LSKNSQPFGKKFQKTVGGDFFDSHCMYSLCVWLISSEIADSLSSLSDRQETEDDFDVKATPSASKNYT